MPDGKKREWITDSEGLAAESRAVVSGRPFIRAWFIARRKILRRKKPCLLYVMRYPAISSINYPGLSGNLDRRQVKTVVPASGHDGMFALRLILEQERRRAFLSWTSRSKGKASAWRFFTNARMQVHPENKLPRSVCKYAVSWRNTLFIVPIGCGNIGAEWFGTSNPGWMLMNDAAASHQQKMCLHRGQPELFQVKRLCYQDKQAGVQQSNEHRICKFWPV